MLVSPLNALGRTQAAVSEKSALETNYVAFVAPNNSQTPGQVWNNKLRRSTLPIPGGFGVFLIHHGSKGVTEKPAIDSSKGYAIAGAPFEVFVEQRKDATQEHDPELVESAVHTVVEAFSSMVKNRAQLPRFSEAFDKGYLNNIIVEPQTKNRDGKEFSFLVARTEQKGKVNFIISAKDLEKNGFLNQPEKLITQLEKEFQWVLSKAETKPKQRQKNRAFQRDLSNTQIFSNKEIRNQSGVEREQALTELFKTYLTTSDAFKSLENQPYYDIGTTSVKAPRQPDSSTEFYDIRIREALRMIVREPTFMKDTPRAVRSLLNGKIWSVTFVKVEDRDWATRTRVVPEDESVVVGKDSTLVQPAKILVNYHRTATAEDPFYAETAGLPMGALSTQQLAQVIAMEIEKNIVEKSMRGHVAQDEMSEPQLDANH
ncbi:MAG: hypothetical protein R3C68_19510 [Myxococcota bacterium]